MPEDPNSFLAFLLTPLYVLPWLGGTGIASLRIAGVVGTALLIGTFAFPAISTDFWGQLSAIGAFAAIGGWALVMGTICRLLSFELPRGKGAMVVGILGACVTLMPITYFFDWYYSAL